MPEPSRLRSTVRRIPLSQAAKEEAEITVIESFLPSQMDAAAMEQAVAAAVAALPVWFHRDLADRIILASVQVLGGSMLTRDLRIIDAALVPTLV